MYTTARYAAPDAAPPPIRYCVTADGPFRKTKGLDPDVTVVHPHEYVEMVRASRRALALPAMRTTT